jgi:hypothetical protein
MTTNTNLWWGYLHTNGSIQVKRFFDQRDLSEAMESDFVDQTFGPFQATDRTQALSIIEEKLA